MPLKSRESGTPRSIAGTKVSAYNQNTTRMATQPRHSSTLEEYLERERLASEKSEFYAGEIYLMAGGTITHSRLCIRIGGMLDGLLESCQVYDSNLKLFIKQAQHCVYPDAMALCGTPEFIGTGRDVILNPTLVAEILSPSTESYDKGAKTIYYRTVPSLQHCLLFSQDRVYVEHSERKDDGTWLITQYTQREKTIPLKSMQIEIPIRDVYRNIL